MRVFHVSLCAFVALVNASCNQGADESMDDAFRPPGIASLAEIDVANVPYEPATVLIEGVVSPSSQAGWAGLNDRYKVHTFTLAAWRCLGGPIVKQDLTVLWPIPAESEVWGHFEAYSIRRIKVLLSKDGTRAIVEGISPRGSDDESLSAIAKELKNPIVVSTERFGELVLDRSIGWFEGEAVWNGEAIRVTFPVEEGESIGDALDVAERLWLDQGPWKKRIDDFAVQELLELKNGTWLEEGESELTASEFISRMKLDSIQVFPDGQFEFWHNDGDLFWGHSIQVSGSVTEGPTHADIPG